MSESVNNSIYRVDSYNLPYDEKVGFIPTDEDFLQKLNDGEYDAVSIWSYVQTTEEEIPEIERFLNTNTGRRKAKQISDETIVEIKEKARNKQSKKAKFPFCAYDGCMMYRVLEPELIPNPTEYAENGIEIPEEEPDVPLPALKAAKFLLKNSPPASYIYGNSPTNVHIDLLPVTVENQINQIYNYLDAQLYNFAAGIYNMGSESIDEHLEKFRNYIAMWAYHDVDTIKKISERVMRKVGVDLADEAMAISSRAIYGGSYSFNHPNELSQTEHIADWVKLSGGKFNVKRTHQNEIEHSPLEDPILCLHRTLFKDGIKTLPRAINEVSNDRLRPILAAHMMSVLADNILPLKGYKIDYLKSVNKYEKELFDIPENTEIILEAYENAKHKQEDASFARAVVQEFIDLEVKKA